MLARVQASLRSSALVREIERTRDDLNVSHRLLSSKQQELESELQCAADFVRSQLPQPGTPAPGIAMHWAYQPSLALGGDLFQVCQWGADTLGFYILDASGHGVAAALRAIALTSFLREDNLAKAVGSYDPGAIINEANRRFPLTQDGEYFTLWVGRLHLGSRALFYAGGRARRSLSPLRRANISMVVIGQPSPGIRRRSHIRYCVYPIAWRGPLIPTQ